MNKELTTEQLFQYINAKIQGNIDLDVNVKEEIEKRLQSDESFRREAEKMEAHIHWLRSRPHPVPPSDLASRCLQYARQPNTSTFLKKWPVWASGCAVVLLLCASVYFNQFTENLSINLNPKDTIAKEEDPFPWLVKKQEILLDEIETLSKQRMTSSESPLDGALARFKRSGIYLESYYQSCKDDFNARRAISIALYQNIQALEALKEALQENAQPSRSSVRLEPTQSDQPMIEG